MDPNNPPNCGFAKLHRQVLFDKSLSAYDRLIFATISSCDYSKGKRGIIISRTMIGALVGCSLDVVKDGIKRLRKAGYISWRQGCSNRTNEYFIHVRDGRLGAPVMGVRGHPNRGDEQPHTGVPERHLLETENNQIESRSRLEYEGRTCWLDETGQVITMSKRSSKPTSVMNELDKLIYWDGESKYSGVEAYNAALAKRQIYQNQKN